MLLLLQKRGQSNARCCADCDADTSAPDCTAATALLMVEEICVRQMTQPAIVSMATNTDTASLRRYAPAVFASLSVIYLMKGCKRNMLCLTGLT